MNASVTSGYFSSCGSFQHGYRTNGFEVVFYLIQAWSPEVLQSCLDPRRQWLSCSLSNHQKRHTKDLSVTVVWSLHFAHELWQFPVPPTAVAWTVPFHECCQPNGAMHIIIIRRQKLTWNISPNSLWTPSVKFNLYGIKDATLTSTELVFVSAASVHCWIR